MSLIDPECHPQFHHDGRLVCAGCFADEDLQGLIRRHGTKSRCGFCGSKGVKALGFDVVSDHIVERANQFYGKAGDQLPYESREGGWQGENFDSYDLLMDEIGLELPRDHNDELFYALVEALGEDQWCAYDWTQLELDESLEHSWRSFERKVKHRRRFFFHGSDGRPGEAGDDRSPLQFFRELQSLLVRLRRVKELPIGYALYRARERSGRSRHTTPASLGPPPEEYATQANRMNPPGIPMFYGAETRALAIAEVRNKRVSIGRFETTRPIHVVDLVDLPAVPGFFSEVSRPSRQYLSFLRAFSREIAKPVPRDDRVHVDYVPTQVFTEFLRDARFGNQNIDGIRYPSATSEAGANVVLFATQRDVIGAVDRERCSWDPEPWLELKRVRHFHT